MSQSVHWIFDSALSHTRRSDAVEIRVETLAQIRLSTSFESSLVSVKTDFLKWLSGPKNTAQLLTYIYSKNCEMAELDFKGLKYYCSQSFSRDPAAVQLD